MTCSSRGREPSLTLHGLSVMAIDCCIGDFDAMSQIELPFGDTITIMGEPQYPAERELKDRRSPGYPMPRADMNRPQIEADAHADDRNIVSSEGPSSECDLETFRPLQYARRHGLTRNYFDQSPLIGACMSRLRSVPTDPDHCELTRSERVSARAAVEQAEKDRWNIDKDTAELLTLTLAMGRPDDLDEETDTVKISDLKIEEPVLASVPDMDVARLRARNAIRISTTGIKVYALDVENGESLEWPPDDLRLPSAMATFIAAEKLDIDIETADTLKEIMKRRQSDLWKAVEEAIAIDEVSSQLLQLHEPGLTGFRPAMFDGRRLHCYHTRRRSAHALSSTRHARWSLPRRPKTCWRRTDKKQKLSYSQPGSIILDSPALPQHTES